MSAAFGGILVASTALVGATPSMATTGGPVSEGGVVPTYVDGNPTCVDLGFTYGAKWNYPDDSTGGTYPLGTGEVTWSTDGVYVDWSSTFGVDAVIVKGGSNANSYVYDPLAESFGDGGLASPINSNTGEPYGLSHVEFCYDYEVAVTKTADTSFTRTYDWTIDKVGDQTALRLMPGQQFLVNYDVTVAATYLDSDFAVEGMITITNPDPNYPAKISGVGDVVSPDIAAAVDCGVGFPYDLAAGGTLTCDYDADLPDATQRVNTATVTVDAASKVGGGSDTADVIFGAPTTEVDECIEATDDLYGALGTVCANEAPKTFEYSMTVGAYQVCGEYSFVNVASFVSNDTSATGSDSWTVLVDVPCETGCTLTLGYWKTHSELGPAPYDDTWALLPGGAGADTSFFNSGLTYFQAMNMPVAKNAYFILAPQYAAAELNLLNGADGSAIVDTMAAAEALFEAQGPDDVTLDKAQTTLAKQLAEILDQYNNGLTGPGYCSE